MSNLEKLPQENSKATKNNENTKCHEEWRNRPDYLLTKKEKRILKREELGFKFLQILVLPFNLTIGLCLLPVILLGFFYEKGFDGVVYVNFKIFMYRALFYLTILVTIALFMLFIIVI